MEPHNQKSARTGRYLSAGKFNIALFGVGILSLSALAGVVAVSSGDGEVERPVAGAAAKDQAVSLGTPEFQYGECVAHCNVVSEMNFPDQITRVLHPVLDHPFESLQRESVFSASELPAFLQYESSNIIYLDESIQGIEPESPATAPTSTESPIPSETATPSPTVTPEPTTSPEPSPTPTPTPSDDPTAEPEPTTPSEPEPSPETPTEPSPEPAPETSTQPTAPILEITVPLITE